MSAKVDYKIKGVVYPNVELGRNVRVDEGAILGFPEDVGTSSTTTVGSNCLFRANTLVYEGVSIGKNVQTGPNVLIRERNIIGNGVWIWHGSTLNPGNKVGDGTRIHVGCFLEDSILGKKVFLGPNVVFANDPHPTMPPDRTHFGGAVIEDEVVIGAGVTILPYIRIGKRALIGAGSVVTKNVPPGEVWVGNPARFLKRIEEVTCEVKEKLHYPYKEFWKIK